MAIDLAGNDFKGGGYPQERRTCMRKHAQETAVSQNLLCQTMVCSLRPQRSASCQGRIGSRGVIGTPHPATKFLKMDQVFCIAPKQHSGDGLGGGSLGRASDSVGALERQDAEGKVFLVSAQQTRGLLPAWEFSGKHACASLRTTDKIRSPLPLSPLSLAIMQEFDTRCFFSQESKLHKSLLTHEHEANFIVSGRGSTWSSEVCPALTGHHSLFSVHRLFLQVLGAFVHGLSVLSENAEFTESLLCSLFTIQIHGRMVH